MPLNVSRSERGMQEKLPLANGSQENRFAATRRGALSRQKMIASRTSEAEEILPRRNTEATKNAREVFAAKKAKKTKKEEREEHSHSPLPSLLFLFSLRRKMSSYFLSFSGDS